MFVIHPSSYIAPRFRSKFANNIEIGQGVFINMECYIDDSAPVVIGDYVLIGPRVQIITSLPKQGVNHSSYCQPSAVRIEQRSWLCGGAVICAGVTIGEGSVVAAGAVVTENVPPHTLVGGNPAKEIRRLR